MIDISNKIFNVKKTDYEDSKLFFGQQPGLFDTINRKFPKIHKLLKTLRNLDWDENEFDYSSCNTEFKTCDKTTYDMMLKTLAWQWEADSVAARSITPILGSVVTDSDLWRLYSRIAENEQLHAATYSEIVRNSFDDPSEILDEILKVQEAMARLTTIAGVMDKAYWTSHKYALGQVELTQETYNDIYMFLVALLCLERIQFMASFAVTFAICETGLFMPIGKAVQKIAQDEFEIHVQTGLEVLREEYKTEFGRNAYEQQKGKIKQIIEEVVQSESEWLTYAFSEGRELTGVNERMMKDWVKFNATTLVNFFNLDEVSFDKVETNPLPYMAEWLDISKFQTSPQEEDNNQYKVNVMTRDDENEEFDMDF